MLNTNSYTQEDVLRIIDELENILSFMADELKLTAVRNSKLQKWKDISLENNVSPTEKIPYVYQIHRYVRALRIIKKHYKNIKTETLKKIYKGTIDDFTHESENFLFELEMASRLLCSKLYQEKNFSINLKERTDIIINNEIFVECKRIKSIKSFENNIRDANNQLEKLKKGEFGIIALDISNLLKEEYFGKIKEHEECINNIFDENIQLYDHVLQKLISEKYYSITEKLNRLNFKLNERVIGLVCQAEILIPMQESFICSRAMKYEKIYLDEWIEELLESILFNNT